MILFSLLLLGSLEGGQAHYDCRNTDLEVRCGIFKITKTMRHYKIQQCLRRQCSVVQNHFIECDNVCDYCNNIIIPHEVSCSDNKNMCEIRVDNFLTNICTCPNITSPPTQAIVSSGCTSSKTATEAIMVREITTEQSSSACSSNQTDKASTEAPETILGVLIGILLVILALVITGWMWTCWTVKKRSNKTHLCTKCQDCQEKRSYPNPTYEMTIKTQPVVSAATQHHSQKERNGQTNNAFNRGDDQGHSDVRNTDNFHDNENHNHLDVQDNHTVNGTAEERESGEEHMYHVLEKSGDGDYEDPDKDLEENTAMEYETPVPLTS